MAGAHLQNVRAVNLSPGMVFGAGGKGTGLVPVLLCRRRREHSSCPLLLYIGYLSLVVLVKENLKQAAQRPC